MKVKTIRIKEFLIASMLMFSASQLVASDLNWHEESENYHVYLGVVPASMIKSSLSLVDNDKNLHGGLSNLPSEAQHVMVTIYRKDGKTRVANATVIAEISSGVLLGRKKLEKPLEKMITNKHITYANFFEMKDKGKYKIELEIYEPNKNGKDEVTFFHEK